MDRLLLIRPTTEHEADVFAYRDEMTENGDSLDGCGGLEKCDSYAYWLDFEGRGKEWYGESYCPSDLFLVYREADMRLVGMIDYRHPISDFLLRYGGNIGYSVRPSERRKGYATEMMRLLLPFCKSCGDEAVLLTCDRDNEGSRRTIIASGGIMENEVPDEPGLGKSGWIQRYWVKTN